MGGCTPSPSRLRRSSVWTFGRVPIYPISFLHLTGPPKQRTLLNSFVIKALGTLFIATGGVPPPATLLCATPRTLRLCVIVFPRSAILIAVSRRCHQSHFHPRPQGAPCSRFG